ncbi:MAG: sensor histidine kinase [Bacteroidetes bacterium]|nr:sensor histidine kinase [Bacteroidota bacterium]MBS1648912.1 sensor histidine kinase [Bacteroidota bacterium]
MKIFCIFCLSFYLVTGIAKPISSFEKEKPVITVTRNFFQNTDTLANLLNECKKIFSTNLSLCLEKAKAGTTLAQQQNNKYIEARFLNIEALVYTYQSHFDDAIHTYNSVINIADQINSNELRNMVYGNLGLMYWRQGNTEKAVLYSLKSAKLNEIANNYNALAKDYANISNVFYSVKNALKTKQYADSALLYFKKTNDISGIANIYNTYGVLESDNKAFKKASTYYLLSLQYKKQLADNLSIANTYNNIGNNYFDLKEYPKAKLYFDSALVLYKKNNQQEGIARVLTNQANLLAKIKDSAAIKKSTEVDSVSLYVGSLETRTEILYNLAVNARLNGKYKKAAEYYQRYFYLKDSLFNKETVNAVYEMETKFQSAKKQQQINLLSKDATIKQLEVKKKNQLLVLLGIAFLFLLFAAYLYYRWFKNKKEQQLKNTIARQHIMATQALFEGEQKERIRIGRDLHDSIGQMLSVVKMQVSTLNTTANNESKALTESSLQLIDKTIAEVRSISHNLIPEELNFGLINAIEELTNNINKIGNILVSFNYDERITQFKLAKQTELSVYRIVQEVLSNMVKHAEASQVNVDITYNENKIILHLKDNGKGFDTSIINHSMGIGWKNIMARVSLLNGNMQLQSEKITGTQIEITIPNEQQ